MSFSQSDFKSAIEKLVRYGTARDRKADNELRNVTLTDDEALALLTFFREGGIQE